MDGYFCEKEQFSWWQSSFVTQGSHAFLSAVFVIVARQFLDLTCLEPITSRSKTVHPYAASDKKFLRLCEVIVKQSKIKRIDLITGYDDEMQKIDLEQKLDELKQSLLEFDVIFEYDFKPNLHDREIRLYNGWTIKIGRGLGLYQKPLTWNEVRTNDLALRKYLETKVDIYKS